MSLADKRGMSDTHPGFDNRDDALWFYSQARNRGLLTEAQVTALVHDFDHADFDRRLSEVEGVKVPAPIVQIDMDLPPRRTLIVLSVAVILCTLTNVALIALRIG